MDIHYGSLNLYYQVMGLFWELHPLMDLLRFGILKLMLICLFK